MNPIIKQQLNSVKFAKIPPFDDSTTKLVISKQDDVSKAPCEVGKYYEIQVEDYIIHPSANFDLHVNWNKNVIPKDAYMRCEVTQVMGKMIKINGVGFDFNTKQDTGNSWEGWLPRKSIKYMKQIG